MENKKKQKGNLRSKLLKTASEMLSKEGLNKLTLRALGQRVGVSRAAPYRHFVNKNDLLCAVAEEGFKEFKALYQKINSDSSISASEKFKQIGMAYIKYAIQNPGPYRLMFGHELIRQKRTPGLREAAKAAYGEMLVAVEAYLKENEINPENLIPLSNNAWITVHGVSTLLIEGQFTVIEGGQGVPSLLMGEESQIADDDQLKSEFAKKILDDFMAMTLSEYA